MELLDTRAKQRRNILLFTGYVLIGAIILVLTWILVYNVRGYSYDRKSGQVIQKGLVFIDSAPSQADVSVEQLPDLHTKTDARLELPEGSYTLKVTKTGYREWRHPVTIEGGKVVRLQYPILFPLVLSGTSASQARQPIEVYSLSPDRHWLVWAESGAPYPKWYSADLQSSQENLPIINLTLPASLAATFSKGSWSVVGWSSNGQLLLLEHVVNDASDFVIVDRENPANSLSLNSVFGVTLKSAKFKTNKNDQLYVLEKAGGILRIADLKSKTLTAPLLNNVDAFAVQDDTILSVQTTDSAGRFMTLVENSKQQKLKDIDKSAAVPKLMMGSWDGKLYFATLAPTENRALIYIDPLTSLHSGKTVVPSLTLKVNQASKLLSSPSGRYMVVQGDGNEIAAFDNETAQTASYLPKLSASAKMLPLTWFDDTHIAVLDSGNALVWDYDGTNMQSLGVSLVAPLLSPDRQKMFTINDKRQLVRTPLVIK